MNWFECATDGVGSTVALRLARRDEHDIIRRIAALDDAKPLTGDALLALVDAEPVAALSLTDGRVVANPFVPTAQAVSLLRLRARQISDAAPRKRRPGILHPRSARP